MALEFSINKRVGELAKQYGRDLTKLPQNILDELAVRDKGYHRMLGLLRIYPRSLQTPRFQLVDSAGEEIFRSIPL